MDHLVSTFGLLLQDTEKVTIQLISFQAIAHVPQIILVLLPHRIWETTGIVSLGT